MDFKDFFSQQASEYAKYRPGYPEELFKYLGSITNEHKRAWDSAAGNGQAALGLAEYFDEVLASDASETQIQNAVQHPKIKYFIAPSENSGIEPHSVNIVTVATAIHWFNLNKFYDEVKRVLVPGGTLAVWNYGEANVNEKIDKIFHRFLYEVIGSYAAPEFWKGINQENEIDFPFERIKTPLFKMKHNWSFNDYKNFVMTWSPVRQYIKLNNTDPLELIIDELKNAWGNENEKKEISWKLMLKAAKIG